MLGMHGKVCMITGATSGIGKATALALGKLGARLVLVCRDQAKAQSVVRELRECTGNGATALMIGDLSRLRHVRAIAAEFSRDYERLDVLVNNAGAMFPRRFETEEGFEMTLAVNHLAPFLLTNLLIEKLKAAGAARVINVNSDAHEKAVIDFDDIQMRHCYPRGGVGMRAYGKAKLANLLTTYELARRLRDTGVTVNALHPGYVATNILPLDTASGPICLLNPLWRLAKHAILTPEQGAATPVYLASSADIENLSGFYFEKCTPVASSSASRDNALQSRMWNISEELTTG